MSSQDLSQYPAQPQTVAEAAQADRMLFLRKTYSLVLLGVAVFAGTIMALGNGVPVVIDLANAIYRLGPIVLLIVLLGSAIAVRALARTPVVGMAFYLVYAALLALIIGPFAINAGEGTATAAAVMTVTIFGGLTAYVFITKQDFSWMGGALWIGLFAMIGIAIVAMLTGLQLGAWYSIFGALLFSGFILYDTSKILRHNRVEDALPAAIELFVDIVLLFWHLLSLMNRD